MEYVVVFIAGAVASAAGLMIWYFGNGAALAKRALAITKGEERLKSNSSALAHRTSEFATRQAQLDADATAFNARKIQYDSMVSENNSLKQDLFNLAVQIRKTERDQASLSSSQDEISRKANELAQRYLKESVAWISAKLSANNFTTCKQRLLDVIERCHGIGYHVPDEKQTELVNDLKKNYDKAVREEFAREEQARIKARIREQEKLEREVQKALQEAERETLATKLALEQALRKSAAEQNAVEIEHLKAKLVELEEKKRAISQAQLTKAGHIYVISNIGAFGEGVFKVGMTRRLEPKDRVDELCSASVPFPFDVHMMISCDNALHLENALHRELHKKRVNKVNLRKEFFRVDLESILRIVEHNHGEVEFFPVPEAEQYRQSLTMSDEDYEFIQQTVQSAMGETGDFTTEE